MRWLLIGGCALVAIALQWVDQGRDFFRSTEYLVTDKARQILATDEPEQRILIVDIDEASLAAQGPWPWPRARVADLAERLLFDYGAKAVGLDIVFPAAQDDRQAGDARLAALGQHAPLIFAQAFDFSPRDQPLQTGVVVPARSPTPSVVLEGSSRKATGFVANHAGFSDVRCVGNIGISPDDDGRIRRVPLQVDWRGQASRLLPLAMLDCVDAMAGSAGTQASRSGRRGMAAAVWELPYARQWEAYTVVSAHEVLTGEVPSELVRGRWVFVGSSALGLNDRAATPLSSMAAGVMVHASAMTSLLDWRDGDTGAASMDGRWIATLWIVLTLPLLGMVMRHYRAWVLLPVLLLLSGAWMGLVLWGLQHQLQFSAVSPLMAYALVMLMVPLEWWLLQREQGAVLRSFATYVAPAVLQQMLRQGILQPMVPQHRLITVISADMQNYTGLTSQSTLHEAATLTREFLHSLTGPVLAQGGTLDKYTGDGLVAFWGAPLPTADHAVRALEAARQMVLEVRHWNEQRIRQGLPPARVRIGIESGPALVGDLGTEFRRTYTAVGDCINLASKLQAAARHRSVDLVVGPHAAQLLREAGLAMMFLASERLPGKNEPVMLWTIESLTTSVPPIMPPPASPDASIAP